MRDDRPNHDQCEVSGARTRISTFVAGVSLLGLIVGLGDVVGLIPMAALVAVMIMVSLATMDWHSIAPATLRRMPRSETMVMAATVAVTVFTHNLAYGVIGGSLTAMVLFARRVAHMVTVERAEETTDDDGRVISVVYRVTGELFFASSNDRVYQFDYLGDPDSVVIDMSDSHIWDASTVAALDAITTKYAAKHKSVEIIGLNQDSADRNDLLSGKFGAAE